MNPRRVVVHDNAEILAAAAAARLITAISDAQADHGTASVVLTGGGTGIAVLEQVRYSPACEAVDWSQVEFFWGDERFLPDGDPDRNVTQARKALLDHIDIDPARVHPMAPSDGKFGDDADAAAAHYAEVLATLADAGTDVPVPAFDVLMLGVGEEGHIASLFPGTAEVQNHDRFVVGVHNCPKPPPTRISLTLPAIQAATEVWLMTTGASKAAAIQSAFAEASPVELPASGAIGRRNTLWLLDDTAAADVPGI